jgi:hypothetical protein
MNVPMELFITSMSRELRTQIRGYNTDFTSCLFPVGDEKSREARTESKEQKSRGQEGGDRVGSQGLRKGTVTPA